MMKKTVKFSLVKELYLDLVLKSDAVLYILIVISVYLVNSWCYLQKVCLI